MSVLPVGFGSATNGGGYQIERSLRFNSADSAYLNRTPGSASNRKTWTWSGWVKRTAVTSTGQNLFSTDNGSSTTIGQLFFNDNILEFNCYASSAYQWRLITTQVWRDLSAWYHIVAVVDTTQATSSNRVKLYVNGVQITAFTTATYPSLNFDGAYNLNQPHYVGAAITSSGYLNGYLTEVNFIDGQALTPSSFGETDSATGVWKPKAYTGTYGTNGFYLKFADNSGTTSTTLGKDSSGNSNNWTPNNFSVTAGTGNDSLVDSPTAYGTDTGVGGEVRGNYSTFNPLDFFGTSGLSNGNLDVSAITVANFGTIKITSGKWYFEFRKNANGDNQLGIASGNVFGASSNFGTTAFRRAWRDDNGSPNWLTDAGNPGSGTAQSLATGDILGVALDLDNNAVYFAKNNTWMNSGAPTSGASKTGAIWTDLSGGIWQVYCGGNANGCYTSLNTGQRAFAYTAPSGFKALCTTNLPTPTIGATSSTLANKYFNTILYTGNGNASRSITGVGFQPDFVWAKARSAAYYHGLFDAVRSGYALYSNTTDVEDTTEQLTFGSDGFTTPNKSGDFINTNSATYVAWNWNAGGSNATNTSGTITSTVRANTTSGFSIVTYTGTGSNATVGHGLGVAPSMVIVKQRTDAGRDWYVWHTSLTNATYCLALNTTDAQFVLTTAWNSTAPASSVFSVGTSVYTNASTKNYVAYCFAPVAGYSAFGSYTGNGSADGVFVYTGFRPKFVMIKGSSVITNWTIVDAARNTSNVTTLNLRPNTSGAETTDVDFDLLSNGFKLRGSGSGGNNSGSTYIYMAIAESPFKFSLGR